MSFNEFIEFISNGITLFINSMNMVINSLLSNYLIISMLGIVIFIYLFDLIYYIIQNPSKNVREQMEKWDNAKRDYLLYSDVKLNVMKTHPQDVYQYKYTNLLMSKEVQLNYLKNYEGIEYLIKSINHKLGREVALDSLKVNQDLEFRLKFRDYSLKQEVWQYNNLYLTEDRAAKAFHLINKKGDLTDEEKKQFDSL